MEREEEWEEQIECSELNKRLLKLEGKKTHKEGKKENEEKEEY